MRRRWMRMDPMMRKDAAMRGKLLRFGPAARAARFSYVVRQQIRIPQSPLASSKLAPISTATNTGAKVCSRIGMGMSKEWNESGTADISDYYGNTINTGTRSHRQLRKWERLLPPVPTPQLRKWEHVPANADQCITSQSHRPRVYNASKNPAQPHSSGPACNGLESIHA